MHAKGRAGVAIGILAFGSGGGHAFPRIKVGSESSGSGVCVPHQGQDRFHGQALYRTPYVLLDLLPARQQRHPHAFGGVRSMDAQSFFASHTLTVRRHQEPQEFTGATIARSRSRWHKIESGGPGGHRAVDAAYMPRTDGGAGMRRPCLGGEGSGGSDLDLLWRSGALVERATMVCGTVTGGR